MNDEAQDRVEDSDGNRLGELARSAHSRWRMLLKQKREQWTTKAGHRDRIGTHWGECEGMGDFVGTLVAKISKGASTTIRRKSVSGLGLGSNASEGSVVKLRVLKAQAEG